MRPATIVLAAMCLAAASCAHAPPAAWVDDVAFAPVSFAPGVSAAWLAGEMNASAIYTLRVHIAHDARMPPHTHPDARMITVVSGEIYYGQGLAFDPEGGSIYSEGDFFVVPANTPHYVWAKSGAAVYQESGVGPTATVPLPGTPPPTP